MPDKDSYSLCPNCASPNTFKIGERGAGQDRQVKRECVCGEAWWSSELSTSKPQASSEQAPRFTHEDWKRKVLQVVNNLDRDPDRLAALRKRIF